MVVGDPDVQSTQYTILYIIIEELAICRFLMDYQFGCVGVKDNFLPLS